MERFTYDVESTVLTSDEYRGFADAVHALCYLQTQHAVSDYLAGVKSPCGEQYQDHVQRRARTMWRTAVTA